MPMVISDDYGKNEKWTRLETETSKLSKQLESQSQKNNNIDWWKVQNKYQIHNGFGMEW